MRRVVLFPGSGVAAFAPSDLASIVDWATGDDVTTDGEGINAWTGREGNIVCTQATGTKKPALSGGAAVFDGDDWLATNQSGGSFVGGPYSQANVVAVRYKLDSTSGGHNVFGGILSSARHNFRLAPGNRWIYAGTVLSDAPSLDTDWHSAVATFDGASSELRIDGSAVLSGDAGAHGLSGLTFGTHFGQSSDFFVGQIKGWAVVESAVTGDDLTNLETWLGDL